MEKKIEKISTLVIVLGGNDLEMRTIENLAIENGVEVISNNLGWGCNLEMVLPDVMEVIEAGKTPVCIELPEIWKDQDGIEHSVQVPEGTIMIDHHGKHSDKPASIIQICKLFGWNITREIELIGANDSNYIPGMIALGASEEEINAIRLMDRQYQGVTEEQEIEALRALENRSIEGRITIVHMKHSKCSPVTDRLFGFYDILFIVSSDNEKNIFAPESDIQALVDAGLTEWNGAGFAGSYKPEEELLDFLRTL